MQTTITPIDASKELKQIEHITLGNFIRASITDETVIGINVYASSSIRKQAFTLPYMENFCISKGWTVGDVYPCTSSIQIYFN